MKISSRMIALVLAGAAVFACSQSDGNEGSAATSTSLSEGASAKPGETQPGSGAGGEQNAQRTAVIKEVQAALASYRESRSASQANAIDERFAGTSLVLDRKTGELVQRVVPVLERKQIAEGLVLAASRSAASLSASVTTALGDLVWHAATHVSTTADEQQLVTLTVARTFSSVIIEGGTVVSDGGVPEGGTTTTDAGAKSDASTPYDAGAQAVLDWCNWCKVEREETLEEKLFKKACKAGLKALRRYESEQEPDPFCWDPSDCPSLPMPRMGWRGRIRAGDLLNGELSGSLSYGFRCGRTNIQITGFTDGFGGSDPDFGATISFGIDF